MAVGTGAKAIALWEEYMRAGEFEAAWRISDRLLTSPTPFAASRPAHQRSIWRGGALEGRRLLVRCHHGLGDTIQFIRFAPLLRERTGAVLVAAQPELIPLLRSAAGVDALLPLGAPDPDHDLDLEIMELPYILRTTLATIPASVPYLRIGPVARRPTRGLRVGLVWSAGGWDPARSIPPELLEPLAGIPHLDWHLLQRGPASEGDLPRFGRWSGAEEILPLARTLQTLDLLLTIDSMPAHLAGALGIPVWTLLRAEADWRWMRGRSDTPWYPTMRLFRQDEEGLWEPVVARVAAELGAWARSRGRARPRGRVRRKAAGRRIR